MYICDMQLTAHIHYLLYHHDCVTVPGFGAFLVEQKEAYYDAAKQRYFPPSKELSFNEKLQSNDGILASHLSKSFQTSYERAVLDVHQQMIAWKEKLEKETLTMESLGSFELNREKKLVFTPAKGLNFLAASYALHDIPAYPIVRGASEIPTTPPVYFTLEKNKSRRRFVGYAAAVAGIVSLLAVGSNGYLDQQADAQWQAEQSLRQSAREQASMSVYDLGELPTLTIKLPKTKAPAFYIVAGSFRNESNAQRLVSSLQRKGHTNARKLDKTAKGFYQVSFASFATKREAYNAKAKLTQGQYPGAWVLKK